MQTSKLFVGMSLDITSGIRFRGDTVVVIVVLGNGGVISMGFTELSACLRMKRVLSNR